MRFGVEGRFAHAELVHDAAERPDVGVEGVFLGGADLGRHVVGGADVGGSEVVRLHQLGEAEVAEFDGVVCAEEDWRRVSVRSDEISRTRATG